MMVVAVGSVGMAVRHFFGRGLANAEHFHIKIQGLAGQRMIAINRDVFTLNGLNREDHLLAISAPGLKFHSFFHLNVGWKLSAFQRHLQGGVKLAVGFGRWDGYLLFCAFSQAQEGSFKAWNDLLRPVQIGQGFAGVGAVKDLALCIRQCISQIYDCPDLDHAAAPLLGHY